MFGPDKKKMQTPLQNNVYNTETMLPVSEIRSDTLILKDGWLRAIIKIDGLNLELRNYDEQVVVVEQYKRFLNWLDFPIQILVRNSYLELSDYIAYMHYNVGRITLPALQQQWAQYVSFLQEINSQQWLIYGKEFYVIVPYYQSEDDIMHVRKPWWQLFLDALSTVETPEKIVEKYRIFLKHDKFLDTRVNLVLEWLKGLGVMGERLWLNDIIALLFKVYNPDLHKDQSSYVPW
jgi:hypothetical protein